MPRRAILQAACLLLAGLAIYACAAESSPPNVVFILADDLGYGDLGCYGQTKIQTPRLDRLAGQGMRFTQFYAGSTVCAPSRCVLMTGLHTGHCYIRGNAKVNLRPEDPTVAKLLQGVGYTCGLIGKWGLGHEGSSGVPTRQGFHYFFGYLDQHHAHNYYPSFLMRDESRVPLRNVVPGEGEWGEGVASKKVDYSHDLVIEDALAWLDKNKDKPFFLYLALTTPHANNEATRATGDGQEVPSYEPYDDQPWSKQGKGQAAMITRMDRDIGRVLDRLAEHGLEQKTIVLFSSDNGPHHEGGNDPSLFDPNGPLKGMKRDMYEGGIRVPLIVRWPGKVQAGVTSDHIGYFGDLFATAAELAGAELPAGLDSISFVPTLLGESQRQEKHDWLYWEFYEQGGKQAVRQGRWKAIRMPAFTGKVELYDLEQDLGEEHNLASEQPDVAKKLAALMDKSHVPSPLWKVSGMPMKAKAGRNATN